MAVFHPLTGYLGPEDYASVVRDMRLSDGTLWPIPVSLMVDDAVAKSLEIGQRVMLRDGEGTLLALLDISAIFEPDKLIEAEGVFGTTDAHHPGVAYLLRDSGPKYLGGRVIGVKMPSHYDFSRLRFTPSEVRCMFAKRGWQRVVAFQTRNPMHQAHYEITLNAMQTLEANLLLHPVDAAPPGDVAHYVRVRCYEKMRHHYPEHAAILSLIPLTMRMAGPREALWHAIIRQNFGCTHFIVGRDHAGPSYQGKIVLCTVCGTGSRCKIPK